MNKEIRKLGIDMIDDSSWGTHICQFYETKEDLIDILVPYFKAGLENNEFCMWVTSEPLEADEVKKLFKREVKNLDEYIEKGQIEILDYTEWYIKSGSFDINKVLEGWIEKEEYAIKRGFDGLRLTGNTFWLERKDWKKFTEYEAIVDSVIGTHKMIAMCSYCLDKCRASDIMEVVSNHKFALVRMEGKLDVIESGRRKRIEEAFKESEKKYQDLVNYSNDIVCMVDKDGKFVFLNPAVKKILGFEPEEMIGKSAFDFMLPEDIEDTLKIHESIVKEGKTVLEYENRYMCKDGSLIAISWNATILLDEQGKIIGTQGIGRNITERKRMEKELVESKEFNRALFEYNPIETIVVNCEGKIIDMNRAKGGSGDRLPKHGDIMYKDYAYKHEIDMYSELMKCIKNNIVKEFPEQRYNDKFLSIKISPFSQGAIITCQDITERKKVEEELKESYQYLNNLINYANAPIIVWNPEFHVTRFNNAFEQMTGYNADEVLGKELHMLFPKESRDDSLEKIKTTLNGEYWETVIIPILCKNGEIRYTLWNSANIYSNDGSTLVAVIAQGIDITERKKAEEALKKSETHLSNALRIAKLGHWEYDIVKNQFTFTDEFYTMFRTSAEEMGGYTMSPERYTKLFVYPDDVSVVVTEIQKAIETTDSNYSRQLEHKIVYADGSIGYIAVRFRIIKDSEGNTIKTFGVNQDITDQKHLEEQLQIRQRMDSLGTLAGGIAHDFNNMLAGIMGNLDILYLESENFTDEQKECLRDAKESSEQAASLTRQFQKLSRFEISLQKSIDIYEVTDEVFNLLKRTTDRLIDKEIGFKKGDFFIKGNKSELNQVLLNLGINSCESIEENGVKPGDFVKIDAQKYRAERNDKTGLPEGDYVHIRFADSGTGMSKDVLKKMFDPFYTTKTKGIKKGQGLGLAMVYNIVTRFHNGAILPESKEGKGTIMHIYLPMAEAEEKIKEEPVTEIKGGNETILVVDDEVNILKSVKRILGNYDYNVITASDGEEAIDIYAANRDSIKAVILDLNMPKMSGDMVFEKLLELNPEIKVIIFTGHSDEFAREGILAKSKEYVLKPDFTESLPKTLRKVLDS